MLTARPFQAPGDAYVSEKRSLPDTLLDPQSTAAASSRHRDISQCTRLHTSTTLLSRQKTVRPLSTAANQLQQERSLAGCSLCRYGYGEMQHDFPRFLPTPCLGLVGAVDSFSETSFPRLLQVVYKKRLLNVTPRYRSRQFRGIKFSHVLQPD